MTHKTYNGPYEAGRIEDLAQARDPKRYKGPWEEANDEACAEKIMAVMMTPTYSDFTITIEQARSIVSACGNSSAARRMLPIFGRYGGHVFPSLPQLQWLDWRTADAIQDAWNASARIAP